MSVVSQGHAVCAGFFYVVSECVIAQVAACEIQSRTFCVLRETAWCFMLFWAHHSLRMSVCMSDFICKQTPWLHGWTTFLCTTGYEILYSTTAWQSLCSHGICDRRGIQINKDTLSLGVRHDRGEQAGLQQGCLLPQSNTSRKWDTKFNLIPSLPILFVAWVLSHTNTHCAPNPHPQTGTLLTSYLWNHDWMFKSPFSTFSHLGLVKACISFSLFFFCQK